MQLKHHAISEI